MTEDTSAPLREDVRLLGNILGEVLIRQEGDAVYELVERVRTLSKAARLGEADADNDLNGLIRSLPVADAHRVARAFSHFLALANIAEQHHRIRRRRWYRNRPDVASQRGGLDEVFSRLINGGVSREKLYRTVTNLDIGLVLVMTFRQIRI